MWPASDICPDSGKLIALKDKTWVALPNLDQVAGGKRDDAFSETESEPIVVKKKTSYFIAALPCFFNWLSTKANGIFYEMRKGGHSNNL